MKPPVSILIITYNSSQTLEETLESARQQTYDGPIELIVSDDGSTDPTVDICKRWFEQNGARFVSCKVIESKENTGVSANCNRAILNASGEWAKLIAGDDLMMPDCIADNIRFVSENKEALFVFSKMRVFSVEDGKKAFHDDMPQDNQTGFFKKTAEEQHALLYKENPIPAPTLFCHLDTLKHNLYQEQYRYCEDAPQWFYLTGKGYPLTFHPAITVQYRKADSLSHATSVFYNARFMETRKLFFYNEMAAYLQINDVEEYNRQQKKYFMSDFAIHILNNKPNLFTRLLFKLVSMLYK